MNDNEKIELNYVPINNVDGDCFIDLINKVVIPSVNKELDAGDFYVVEFCIGQWFRWRKTNTLEESVCAKENDGISVFGMIVSDRADYRIDYLDGLIC